MWTRTDAKMAPRNVDSVNKAVVDLDELYCKKLFEEDIYFKCILGLAYEYMVLHEGEKALSLIFRCEPDYFKGAIQTQMEQDPLFRDVIIVLTHSLSKAGYLELESDAEAMLKPVAEA